jgi:hypothetical protein
MDTRFFGPSGWQLFHLIAFRSEHPDDALNMMKDVLPCRFCRESTTQFVKEHPLRGDPGKWLYDIHNMVNAKLRKQAATDPKVVDPGPDPSFEEVKAKYAAMKPTQVPGRDFLFAVAYNYPDKPEPADMARQRMFMETLSKVYPFDSLRRVFQSYLSKKPVSLNSRRDYTKWMYGLLALLSRTIRAPILSYRGYSQHVAYFKSGCNKTTYRGKTCRKLEGGGRTKDRDHRKTRRIAHTNLLF